MIRPQRIQIRRTRGWRLQEVSRALNGLPAAKVDRTSRFGNPYRVGDWLAQGPYAGVIIEDAAHCVKIYRAWAEEAIAGRALPQGDRPAPTKEDVAASLAGLQGKNLACWCKLGDPCHADVLLALANPSDGAE